MSSHGPLKSCLNKQHDLGFIDERDSKEELPLVAFQTLQKVS